MKPDPKKTPQRNLFAERRRHIAAARLSATLSRQSLAMCTLDEMTDPTELRRLRMAPLAKQVEQLTLYLVFRTMQRASWSIHRRPFEPPTAEDERVRTLTSRVEKRFRDAMVAAFPPVCSGPPFDVRAFEKTFAAFVAGELRVGALGKLPADDPLFHHGVPDGPNHFGFAEAVLLFLRLGIQTAFWSPTLRTFVCSAQFFAANYWDRSARRWNAYAGQNLAGVITPSAAILSVLDQFYGAMDRAQLAQIFGDLLGASLRDDERISYPVPTPQEFQ